MAKISDLSKITSPSDANVFPISDGLTTKKITYLDLKSSINTVATPTTLGTIKIGDGLIIDDTGRLSVINFSEFNLRTASDTQLGGVIIGSGLTINDSGVLNLDYTLPTASPTVLGAVKVGEGLTISNGILNVIPVDFGSYDDSGITIGNDTDFLFYVENSNTPTIKDDVNGVIVLSVRDTSMAGNLADIRLLARNMTVGLGDETAPALIPDLSGQPMNLGTPSIKWSKVYANDFIGDVTGTADKSTQSDSLLLGLSYLSASTTADSNTIVARDSMGNIAANIFFGNVTGNLLGNATSATELQTSRLINGEPFDGTQNINITASTTFPLTRGAFINGSAATFNGSVADTWSVNATSSNTSNTVVSRDSNGNFAANSVTAVDFIGNVTGNVTGNLTGNVTGNATTASTLANARKINGIEFDGSQDIALPANPARVDELAGSIKMWATSTPPARWLLCNGQSVSKITYPTLFQRIGYTYGGSGNFFNVPNITNRFPVGAGGLYGTNATGGTRDAVVPAHSHPVTASSTFSGNVLPNHNHTFSGNPLSSHSHIFSGNPLSSHSHIFSGNQLSSHTHGVSDPGHTHSLSNGSNVIRDGSPRQRADGGSLNLNIATLNIQSNFTGIGINSSSAGTPSGTINPASSGTPSGTINSASSGTPSGTINSASSGVPSGSVSTSVSIGSAGTSGTDANLPPFISIYYIIKASDDGSGGGTLQAGTGIDIQTEGNYSIISSTVNTSSFLSTAGGTLSGFLTLHSFPSNAFHAANKAYVDNLIAAIPSSNDKLPLTGGSLSGPLYLHANPVSSLQAATKLYTDTKLSLSGGSLSNYLTLHANPVNNMHAATKQYVDNQINAVVSNTVFQQVSGTTSTSITLPAGTWVVQAIWEIHQAAFYQLQLFIDGNLVHDAANNGDPSGTSFRNLFGCATIIGGRSIVVSVTAPQGTYGYFGSGESNRGMVTAFKVQ